MTEERKGIGKVYEIFDRESEEGRAPVYGEVIRALSGSALAPLTSIEKQLGKGGITLENKD